MPKTGHLGPSKQFGCQLVSRVFQVYTNKKNFKLLMTYPIESVKTFLQRKYIFFGHCQSLWKPNYYILRKFTCLKSFSPVAQPTFFTKTDFKSCADLGRQSLRLLGELFVSEAAPVRPSPSL